MNYDKTCQLLIIGDTSVGKTSILTRYTNGTFKEEYLATVGLDYHTKIEDINNQTIQIKLWDTAGQERFKSLTQNLFRNAEGVLLVFDITKNETFYGLKDWISSIKKNIDSQSIFMPIIILGNKIDLEGREVSTEDAEKFAKENNYKYFETSAKTGEGVDNAIREMVTLVLNQNNSNDEQKRQRLTSVQLKKDDEEKPKEKKKGCC